MSILRAMYAGVAGLAAESGALGVVGDNVANTSTIGFKQSRAVFADILGAAVGSHEPGSGVRMVRAQQIFGQGSIVNTGQATDVALSGDGFLVTSGAVDGNSPAAPRNSERRPGSASIATRPSASRADL